MRSVYRPGETSAAFVAVGAMHGIGMDEVSRILAGIRRRKAANRKRDTFGRYLQDEPERRSTQICIRLPVNDRDMIRRLAARQGKTITATVVDAVRYYDNMV